MSLKNQLRSGDGTPLADQQTIGRRGLDLGDQPLSVANEDLGAGSDERLGLG
jgi:hypothetical protein